MIVKSFGCSFTFGTDLKDQTDNTPSRSTWPAIFAREHGHYYRCYARAGIGNLAIADSVLSEIALDHTALFIVNWTWIDRFDYVSADTAEWKTIRPTSRDSTAVTYYKNLHSELKDKLTTLMAIRLVIDSLQEKQFPFVMTYIDDLLFDKKYNTTPTINALQDYVRPYMTTFEGQTFLSWSRTCGYPESSGCHPLEQAHSAAANLVRPVFDN